ncbi:MAG: YgiQ family radical SAM protein [Elusimicrobiota bacterium]
MFLPATPREVGALGWDKLDIILVTGDAYIDSPHIGVAVIGRALLDKGYRVGVISQPDVGAAADISRLGEPALYWGVTSGCMDSMISNRTASGKRRRRDDLTPGGKNTRRPDRALIAYANLIRRHFRNTAPIVLGGLEASLRRVAHYDFWSDSIRRCVLFDAKADLLVYGMGERAATRIAELLKEGKDPSGVRGVCHIAKTKKAGFLELPSYEAVAKDEREFAEMFRVFYGNNEPPSAKGLVQAHGDRYLIHNPPARPLTPDELDHVHNLPYERDAHPRCRKGGEIRALETIRFSITTHRGCYGECNFCAIASHQGRRVVSRSEASIIREAKELARRPGFKGVIADVGGPTANMYGTGCGKTSGGALCGKRRCLFPRACGALLTDHSRLTDLLERLGSLPGIDRVCVASGVRYDLVFAARGSGERYLKRLVEHHISGQLKLAPEHSESRVLRLMGKPDIGQLRRFRELFVALNNESGKRQFLTYYFIAAHPGCAFGDMAALKRFTTETLRLRPEQVQIFTPAPSTYSTLMYHTGKDPFTGEKIFIERSPAGRERQKSAVCACRRG